MIYNSLKTGYTYTLADLFSKDNKIIIPDLQRDYCWGTTNDKDGNNLVDRFIDNSFTATRLRLAIYNFVMANNVLPHYSC